MQEMRVCSSCGADIAWRNETATLCFGCFRQLRHKPKAPRALIDWTSPIYDRRPTDRNVTMAMHYSEGVTLAKIGEMYGCSRERVRQIIKAMGIDPKSGGAEISRKANAAIRVEVAERKAQAKYDCSVAELKQFKSMGMTRAFAYQKRNGIVRGIEWKFSFGDWCRFWIASGKWKKRGRGIGHYCMSRHSDSGAYEIGNVSIKSNVMNGREASEKWKGKFKAHTGVFLLYPGRARAWLAKYGDARLGYYETCEEAVAARDEYIRAHNIDVSCFGKGVGKGRGWTYVKDAKNRPYFMQGPGGARGSFATPEEARSAYLVACDKYVGTKA